VSVFTCKSLVSNGAACHAGPKPCDVIKNTESSPREQFRA
jgi:hypothetical protein